MRSRGAKNQWTVTSSRALQGGPWTCLLSSTTCPNGCAGIDADSSSDVSIRNISILTGDDAIVVKTTQPGGLRSCADSTALTCLLLVLLSTRDGCWLQERRLQACRSATARCRQSQRLSRLGARRGATCPICALRIFRCVPVVFRCLFPRHEKWYEAITKSRQCCGSVSRLVECTAVQQ